MLHYAEYGTPITAATYKKRPFGPTCQELLPVIRDLERSKALNVRDVEYFGYCKKEYVPTQVPVETPRLNTGEIALLDAVIDFVCRNHTAQTISDFSHSRPWDLVEFDAVIPYHSALHLFPNQVSPEAFEWASGEVGAIEAERSKHDPLGYSDFASFRSRVLQESGR
jgi:hypothetical protein